MPFGKNQKWQRLGTEWEHVRRKKQKKRLGKKPKLNVKAWLVKIEYRSA